MDRQNGDSEGGPVDTDQLLRAARDHHRAGRLPEAEALYRRILDQEPAHAGALHLLGVMAYQRGEHQEAIDLIRRAIERSPRNAAYHTNLASAYLAARCVEEALASGRRAVELNPSSSVAHNILGTCYAQNGNSDAAVDCYREALGLNPRLAPALNNLAIALKKRGELDAAVTKFREALELRPESSTLVNLGNTYQDLGQHGRAVACYQRAIDIDPTSAETHNYLAVALKERGRFAEATAACHRALTIRPDDADAHITLGNILQRQNRVDEAIARYRQALEANPDHPAALSNLGNVLAEEECLEEAMVCLDRAVGVDPDNADAHFNRSLLRLLYGDFETGLPEYEWRWKIPGTTLPRYPQPRWDGSPAPGKTILLTAEQGLGDTLQFVRYAALIQALGSTVALHCPRSLKPLLERCPHLQQVVAPGEAPPAFDLWAPIASLPLLFETRVESVPANVPYLTAADELIDRWGTRLRGIDGYKVGVVWQGSRKHRRDPSRSIPLAAIEPLSRVAGVSLVSLQRGDGEEQLRKKEIRFPIVDLGPDVDRANGPFMDTAAIMMNLDLVVTVDTSPAHLAGALGVPVWVAITRTPDWRWLLDRDDTPWYPTMRLFRQAGPGEWDEVLDQIALALHEQLHKPLP